MLINVNLLNDKIKPTFVMKITAALVIKSKNHIETGVCINCKCWKFKLIKSRKIWQK